MKFPHDIHFKPGTHYCHYCHCPYFLCPLFRDLVSTGTSLTFWVPIYFPGSVNIWLMELLHIWTPRSQNAIFQTCITCKSLLIFSMDDYFWISGFAAIILKYLLRGRLLLNNCWNYRENPGVYNTQYSLFGPSSVWSESSSSRTKNSEFESSIEYSQGPVFW